jgi:hypothetical protein
MSVKRYAALGVSRSGRRLAVASSDFWRLAKTNFRIDVLCGYDLKRDGFAHTERTKIQTLGRITQWRSRYIREFAGRAGGRARYIKEVDAEEITVRFG